MLLLRRLNRLLFRNFSSSRKVAVLLDLKEGKLNSSSSNLFEAARKLSPKFSVILSTSDSKVNEDGELLKEKAFTEGIHEIFFNCGESTAEEITKSTTSLIGKDKFTHLITLHDSFGKNCLPRIASKIPESKQSGRED